MVWEYIAAFLAMFFTDMFYTYYLSAIEKNRAVMASIWAGVLYLFGALIVVGYTRDVWILVPAVIGGVLGTYVGVKVKGTRWDFS
jgi:uncharacterized membrane protein YfcA